MEWGVTFCENGPVSRFPAYNICAGPFLFKEKRGFLGGCFCPKIPGCDYMYSRNCSP